MTETRHKVVLFLVCVVALGTVTAAADAKVPAKWANCGTVNARYHHGIGRFGAKDKTVGVPVRNFLHGTLLYNTAIRANKGLDRDYDGIACETV